MTYFMSTKLCSVNVRPCYDYNTRNTTFCRPNLSCNRGMINMHKLWDPHVIQSSYAISTLERVGEPWGTRPLTSLA